MSDSSSSCDERSSFRSASARSSPRDARDDGRVVAVGGFNSGSSRGSRRSRRYSLDSVGSDGVGKATGPVNSNTRLCFFFFFLAVVAGIPIVFLTTTSQLPTQSDVHQRLSRWIYGDEITIHRDPVTKQWGMKYSDSLMLTAVLEGTQAKKDGLSKFLSRRMTHANGLSVTSAESFRAVESHADDAITLRFAPPWFVIGAPIKVTTRVIFQSNDYIEAGSTGVVVRVPGDQEGSVASIKSPGVGVWDAFPGQIEPDEKRYTFRVGGMVRAQVTVAFESGRKVAGGSVGTITKVPGDVRGSLAEVRIAGLTWDAMPGQIEPLAAQPGDPVKPVAPPPTLAAEEVVQLLEHLGHQQYLPRLVSFGLDKLDFLAVATRRDGVALGIKPIHWKRIVSEAQRRIPLSGRGRSGLEQLFTDLGEKSALRRVVSYGIDRLDQLAASSPRDGSSLKFKPVQWLRIVDEAKKRLNMTVSHEEQPMTDGQRGVLMMLQGLGMTRHFKRLVVFGLDSVDRMAASQNISVTINLQGWEWNLIRDEALSIQSGKSSNLLKTSINPDEEKPGDLQEHERLAKEFDEEDAHVLDDKDDGAFRGGGRPRGDAASVLDDVVRSAEERKEDARKKLSNLIQKLTNEDGNAA